MQNFLILRELQTEFLKIKIHFAKISYKEVLIKKTECMKIEAYNELLTKYRIFALRSLNQLHNCIFLEGAMLIWCMPWTTLSPK